MHLTQYSVIGLQQGYGPEKQGKARASLCQRTLEDMETKGVLDLDWIWFGKVISAKNWVTGQGMLPMKSPPLRRLSYKD